MKKEQFYEEMKKALMELKPEEMEISFRRYEKQNRRGLHGCTLSMPDSAAAPTFYFEDLYEAYLCGTSIEDIAQSLINYAKQNIQTSVPGGIDIEDYASVKKKFGLMVIGEQNNREYLKSMVSEKIEDLALVPIIFTKDEHGIGCIKIRNELLEVWGVSAQEVIEEAKKNSPKVLPPTFRKMSDIVHENLVIGLEDFTVPDEAALFVISNEYFAYGASAAFYPGFLESIGKALGKDFFILPSSMNELIILRDFGQDPLELLQIVKYVNRTDVPPEEVLADAVYYYSRNGGFRKILPMETVLV